ncbi:MAG: STAS domain-containing protein, partial [Oscillospiraceae bacterium]|nr:STAS domain-containing protein [Oscillospiraceae bacterium]
EWRHFRHICRFSTPSDVMVLLLTFALTVIFDLVVAISAGLILATFLFMKKMSDVTYVRRWDGKDENADKYKEIPNGTAVYEINGPMFFADSDKFLDFAFEKDIRVMIIRMSGVPSIDATAMKNLDNLLIHCKNKNVRLIISHLNPAPMRTFKKSGFYDRLGEQNIVANIHEALDMASEICK